MQKGCPLVDAGFAELDWGLSGLDDFWFGEVEGEAAWVDVVQEACPTDQLATDQLAIAFFAAWASPGALA